MKKALIKLSALFLVLGGILYIVVQFIHPADALHSVTSSQWLLASILTALMGLLTFLGLLGHYFVYMERLKVLGFIGFSFFSSFWLLTMMFSFIEAFILPLLVETAPDFVEGMVGLFGSEIATVNLGVFPILVNVAGALYILGGVLYGLSGYRNGLPQKYNYLLLVIAALATIAAGILGHPVDRILAIPMGIALFWMGWNLWKIASEVESLIGEVA